MVNPNFDNLEQLEKEVKLARRRLEEGKSFLAQDHLRKALWFLETHRQQQRETGIVPETARRAGEE